MTGSFDLTMEIGIIGLPRSGKTTIFNALTKGNATVASYSNNPNIGVAKVPDVRLDALSRMYMPKKTVAAEVVYTEVPPPPDEFGKTKGIGGDFLNAIQATDALLIVSRAFIDPSVAHVEDTIDSVRDTENMIMELNFSDIEILDRRLNKIEAGFKSAKSVERESLTKEQDFLERIKKELSDGKPLRDQEFSPDESKNITGFGFLSIKPLIVVINIGEGQLDKSTEFKKKLSDTVKGPYTRADVMCAQLEMELGQMGIDEEIDFRKDLGLVESGLNRMVSISYDVVDQISFFTVGEDEVRAWEISRGTLAQKAAGRIHSDLERGFIRAEVISYEELIECGSLGEARKRGLLRQEGKDYIVNDGEIMHVLFNV